MAENRERDLVLAPNEYAFISDQTKGNVISYVGPYKTSMANTDKPVVFNKRSKRFEICNLEEAIQPFVTAPEGWYIVLKNPAKDGNQPQIGTSNSLVPLEIGRKVNLPGPRFFALWPGQMAEVTAGHHLRSNEYLIVRVYEESQARQNWSKAVITPQKPSTDSPEEEIKADDEPVNPENLTMGQTLIIKGTEVSFYIPPTGVEVEKGEDGEYVRKAVTLERLEYCILLDEDGNKRYIQGPAVVFPRPTEKFVEKNGSRKFKAIELNENSGIYVKIIAAYTENGKNYKVGDELFITGKEQMIYFPRTEHALVKYGEQEIYYAIAIPHGEGRYFLNKNTGKVHLQQGPCMFLPDPREAVIVRRILTPKQVENWFPGNKEALDYNLRLQEINNQQQQEAQEAQKEEHSPRKKMQSPIQQAYKDLAAAEQSAPAVFGNSFSRREDFTKPRMIVLNSKYEGAVTIDVWTGYAVLITSRSGERKVIVGPQTYLLEYDEVLQGVELSTGTPKSDERLMRSAYLRVLNNKVSDRITAETKDFCEVNITLSYRVNFTGEADKWYNVENYVKFLTDHLRSVVRNTLKQQSITDFYANGINILRELILGNKDEQTNKRAGWLFAENGMHIYEVEILDIELLDKEIQTLLFKAKHDEIRQQLTLSNREKELDFTNKNENIARQIAQTQSNTRQSNIELQKSEALKQLEYDLTRLENEFKTQQEEMRILLEEQNQQLAINAVKLERDRANQELQIQMSQLLLEQKLQEINAEVQATVQKAQAVSPDLVAALQAFGDKALAEKMAQTMAPLSILGGKSIADVFANLLKGTSLEKVLRLNGSQPEQDPA